MKQVPYKTAHEFARQLLAGPDIMIVLVLPNFDMPGTGMAFPTATRADKIDDKDVIEIVPDPACFEDDESTDAGAAPHACDCGHDHCETKPAADCATPPLDQGGPGITTPVVE